MLSGHCSSSRTIGRHWASVDRSLDAWINRSHSGEIDSMIAVGDKAPEFSLKDHLGREVGLADFRDKSHVLLFFYPLDWTPT